MSNAEETNVDDSAATHGSAARRPKYHEFDEDCVCGNPTGRNAECERCRLVDRLMRAEDLLWRMARHIRNTDELPIVKWGIKSIDLLIAAKEHSPNVYEHKVGY